MASSSNDQPLHSLVVSFLGQVSREAYLSFRAARYQFVGHWVDQLEEFHEEFNEDKRQVSCHRRRIQEDVRERFQRARPKGPTTFPQFGQLPVEIRLQIWEAAMPGPRAVMLRSPHPGKFRSKLFGGKKQDGAAQKAWRSSTRVPVLLHVNSEARAVALKWYRLSLATDAGADADPRIYIDFDRDYVSLSRAEMDAACDALWAATADLDRIRHLAVSYWGYDRFTRLPMLMGRFQRLDDVMIVRSLRWQYGRLPGRAVTDFVKWCRAEKEAEGITHWFTSRKGDRVTIKEGEHEVTVRDLGVHETLESVLET